MANRKRPIVLRCPVTAEERALIEQKMAQLPTQRIGAYLRKMAIDGYIIYTDNLSFFRLWQYSIFFLALSAACDYTSAHHNQHSKSFRSEH